MLRILIADDHEIIRQAIKQILSDEFSFVHIDEASNTEILIEKATSEPWNIILSDMAMPGGGGLVALKKIKEKAPDVPVLFFSAYPEEQYALRAIKAGASGYLTKDTPTEELIKVIHRILSGKKHITPSIAEKLGLSSKGTREAPLHEQLSEREFSIFKMLSSGKSISEIAADLSLATTTVSTYRARILTKMDLKTNADLTLYAIEHKLI